MNFLAGIPNLDARAKTLSCQEILAPVLRAHRRSGREMHARLAPTRPLATLT